MNFIERIIGIIVKPDETTKDIINEPRVEESLVIVGIYSVLVMLMTYISASHLTYTYDTNMPAGLETFTLISTLVMGLLVPLISWPIIAGVLHLFSMVFGGDGKFYPHMMTAIGYSELVKILTTIVAIVLLTQTPVVTLEISMSNPYAAVDAAKVLYENPFYIASTIVGLLGLLWSCCIGVLAVKNGEKLTMTQAAIVVGVPLIIYVAISYGSMLLSLLV